MCAMLSRGGTGSIKRILRGSNAQVEETNLEEIGNECEEQERSRLSLFLDRLEKRIPRLYNVTTVIVIPLLLLIIVAMVCGHFLAVVESQNEIDSLNNLLAEYLDTAGEIESIPRKIEKTYNNCIEEYFETRVDRPHNITDARDFLSGCKKNGMENADKVVKKWEEKMKTDLINGIDLNWNRCLIAGKDKNNVIELRKQNEKVGKSFFNTFNSSFLEYSKTYKKLKDARSYAIEDAKNTIEKSCKVNSAGGAIFWFTIMTTIGYGNTTPQTTAGKMMVYTLGFLSILFFGALSSGAGYVSLTIADDFFETVKLERLTKGWVSVLFWFLVLWLWIIVLAGIFSFYYYDKTARIEPLPNLIWWAFISVTTVGFGDFHIPHDTILLSDMFYVPLVMLLGFVFMANFLLKLLNTMAGEVQKTGLTDDESFHFILKEKRESVTVTDGEEKNDTICREVTVENGWESTKETKQAGPTIIEEKDIVSNEETNGERKEVHDQEETSGGTNSFTTCHEKKQSKHSITFVGSDSELGVNP